MAVYGINKKITIIYIYKSYGKYFWSIFYVQQRILKKTQVNKKHNIYYIKDKIGNV